MWRNEAFQEGVREREREKKYHMIQHQHLELPIYLSIYPSMFIHQSLIKPNNQHLYGRFACGSKASGRLLMTSLGTAPYI